ncbi:MAG: 30S ribosomal protein S16, partial [Candidatus Electrothrix sp. AX5]|nr:30S ribosomal protein S16 [Candidatus Electrothrix sp. AX5]
GTYDPMQDPAVIKLDTEKLQEWMSKGATPTGTVKNLIDKYVAPVIEAA